ncbi:MAG: divalent metal cation transporter, partial [Vicinamibacterales bacterium]
GSAAHVLLPLPTPHSLAVWSTAITLAGYLVMVRGGYGPIERLCKALALVLGAMLVVTAVAVRPSIGAIARGLLPAAPADAGVYSTALLVMALVGTESGSLTNVTYSYFVLEKGWRGIRDLGAQRVDLAIGVAGLLLAGVLLQVVAAATLYGAETAVRSVDDLSRMFSTRFGVLGLTVFAAGLLGKTFSGFVGGTTGYALIASDICRRVGLGVSGSVAEGSDRRHDRIYRVAVAVLSLSPLYVVFTGWKPVILALVSSAAMAALIPLLAIGLLVLGNDRRRLGEHANRWPANTLIVALAVVAMWLIVVNARAFVGARL